jgi:hypothetical protein
MPSCLTSLVDAAGGDPRQVRVGDRAQKRLLSPTAGREQPIREVRACAKPRDLKVDRAGARVEAPLPVPVSVVDPVGVALPVAGAADRVDLRTHQLLGELLDHPPDQIRATLIELLAKPLERLHRS